MHAPDVLPTTAAARRPRHVADPDARRRARRAASSAPTASSSAGREPVIVDTGCSLRARRLGGAGVLGRRPRRRALDLHLARRPRPHRQPRGRARALPERDAARELRDRRPARGRRRAAARAHALGRRPATPSTSATARCTSSARRCSTRRRRAACTTRPPVCSGPPTRSARCTQGEVYDADRRSRRPLRPELRRTQHVEHAVARVDRPRPLRRPRAGERGARPPTSSPAPTARCSAVPRSRTRFAGRWTSPARRRRPRPDSRCSTNSSARCSRRRSPEGDCRHGSTAEAGKCRSRDRDRTGSGVAARLRPDQGR